MGQGTLLQKLGQLFGVSVAAGVLVAALAAPALGGIGIAARNVATGFLNMPSELETPPPPQRSIIYDAEGGVIAEVYDRNRELVELDQIAPIMQQAIIAIEDSRFYEHGGLDIVGTFRAALRTIAGRTQGGSSITQQYVKNVLIESATSQAEQEEARETTLGRKIRELRYAIALEQRMTKDEILEATSTSPTSGTAPTVPSPRPSTSSASAPANSTSTRLPPWPVSSATPSCTTPASTRTRPKNGATWSSTGWSPPG